MEIKKRIKSLQDYLSKNSIEAIIIDNPINLFYLTGQELSAGVLLATQKKAVLLIDSRYIEACKKQCPLPVKLLNEHAMEKLLQTKPYASLQTLGFDSATTSHQKALQLRKTLKKLPDRKIKIRPLDNPVKKLRAVKDSDEINALKRAAALGSEGYDYVCSILKTGITEIEVATELEIFWKRKGSKGLAFESIIAFGPNSSMPHYKPGNVKLKKGQPVLIDIGVNYHHYHSDMTRVPFFGKPPRKIEDIYAVVQEAQEEALKLCVPGTKISDLDKTARAVIDRRGYKGLFTHSLGHGIGLEVHELPFLRGNNNETLQPGMVITIEPGIYIPDVGGIRIEDTVAITSSGYENLTKRSKEPLFLDPDKKKVQP